MDQRLVTSDPPRRDVETLLGLFLAGRSQRTIDAYAADLRIFAQFVAAPDIGEAVKGLLSVAAGDANALGFGYRAHLLAAGLAAATVNRRLAALRSVVKLANMIGFVSWTLAVEGVKHASYRDTRGPGLDGYRKLLAAAREQRGPKARRDVALLRLLGDLALRRGEVAALDFADLRPDEARLWIRSKGRLTKEAVTLPKPTLQALMAWVAVRGDAPGPLLMNFARFVGDKSERRLTGSGVYAIIRDLGNRAGIKARPHGLRHAAITAALDASGGDVRRVQKFSRHRDMRTVLIYDDVRTDVAGSIAAMVATLAEEGEF